VEDVMFATAELLGHHYKRRRAKLAPPNPPREMEDFSESVFARTTLFQRLGVASESDAPLASPPHLQSPLIQPPESLKHGLAPTPEDGLKPASSQPPSDFAATPWNPFMSGGGNGQGFFDQNDDFSQTKIESPKLGYFAGNDDFSSATF